jgi:hypothetical protein
MFAMLRGFVLSLFSGERARALGGPGLRWTCLVALIGLVIQFALGMVLNLYIRVPAADAHASWLQEIQTAPAFLTAHALVGLLLLASGSILLLRAIALRDMVLITPTAAGLAALLGAFAAGEVFVRNGEDSASLSMAILTGVALVCYIGLQAILGAARPAVRGRVCEFLADLGDQGSVATSQHDLRPPARLTAQSFDRHPLTAHPLTAHPLTAPASRGSF